MLLRLLEELYHRWRNLLFLRAGETGQIHDFSSRIVWLKISYNVSQVSAPFGICTGHRKCVAHHQSPSPRRLSAVAYGIVGCQSWGLHKVGYSVREGTVPQTSQT